MNASTRSLILLLLGGAGLVGTYLIGIRLRTRFHALLIGMPLAMALIAVALIGLGTSPIATAALLAGWGLIGTAAPVAWWTWLGKKSQTFPFDRAASGDQWPADYAHHHSFRRRRGVTFSHSNTASKSAT